MSPGGDRQGLPIYLAQVKKSTKYKAFDKKMCKQNIWYEK